MCCFRSGPDVRLRRRPSNKEKNRNVWNVCYWRSHRRLPVKCVRYVCTPCLAGVMAFEMECWKSWSNTSRIKTKKQVLHWGLGCQIPLTAFVCNFTWCALQCHIFSWYIVCSIQINIHANTDMMDEPWREWKVIDTSDISSWGDASRQPTNS